MLRKSTIHDVMKYNNSRVNINVTQSNVRENSQSSFNHEELSRRLIGCTYSYVKGESSDIEIKEILARYPTLINTQQEEFNKTVLHIAVEYNNVELTEFLLKCKGIGLYLADKNGWGIIHYAAHYGNVDVFASVIKKEPKLLEHKAHDEKTPLMIAEEYGKNEIVSFIKIFKEKEAQNINNNALREEKNFSTNKMPQKITPDVLHWQEVIDGTGEFLEDRRGESACASSVYRIEKNTAARKNADEILDDEFKKCKIEEKELDGNGVFEEITKGGTCIIEGHVDQNSKGGFEGDYQIQTLSTSPKREANITVENVDRSAVLSPNTSFFIKKRQLNTSFFKG